MGLISKPWSMASIFAFLRGLVLFLLYCVCMEESSGASLWSSFHKPLTPQLFREYPFLPWTRELRTWPRWVPVATGPCVRWHRSNLYSPAPRWPPFTVVLWGPRNWWFRNSVQWCHLCLSMAKGRYIPVGKIYNSYLWYDCRLLPQSPPPHQGILGPRITCWAELDTFSRDFSGGLHNCGLRDLTSAS